MNTKWAKDSEHYSRKENFSSNQEKVALKKYKIERSFGRSSGRSERHKWRHIWTSHNQNCTQYVYFSKVYDWGVQFRGYFGARPIKLYQFLVNERHCKTRLSIRHFFNHKLCCIRYNFDSDFLNRRLTSLVVKIWLHLWRCITDFGCC